MPDFSWIANTDRLVEKVSQPEYSTRNALHLIKTQVVIEALISTKKIDLKELAKVISSDEESGLRQLRRWRKGRVKIANHKKEIILKHFPEMKIFLTNPIWDLLVFRKMTLNELEDMFTKYYQPNGHAFYWTSAIPDHQELEPGVFGLPTAPPFFSDVDEPYYRADIHGFLLLLFYFRIALSMMDIRKAGIYYEALVNSVPALCRFGSLKKYSNQLMGSVEQLRFLHFELATKFALDWSVAKRQVEEEQFTTRRELQPRNPLTLQFIAPEKCCIRLSDLIGG